MTNPLREAAEAEYADLAHLNPDLGKAAARGTIAVLRRYATCPTCNGDGGDGTGTTYPPDPDGPCTDCNGTGHNPQHVRTAYDHDDNHRHPRIIDAEGLNEGPHIIIPIAHLEQP